MIALVLKSGGQYTPAHAQRLAAACRMAAPGVEVRCLTDMVVEGVVTTPLKHGWRGWWSKLELFRPGVFAVGTRVLYVDLDTVLVGPLTDLLARTEPFLAIGDFYRRPPQFPVRGLGSGLMAWTAGEQDGLYHDYARDPSGRHPGHGDQGFIEARRLADVTFWEDVLPGQVVSYKVHCRQGIPAEARVVCFHGTPKPWHAELRGAPWLETFACR